jgi:hypothetical protein
MAAPKNNTNAEKWTLEKAIDLFEKSIDLSKDPTYDFLGEIAKELETYIDVYDYLTDKFPELKEYKKRLMRNCEANCFSNSKKGNIVSAIGIVNLKSNHGWTDRQQFDHTTQGEKITRIEIDVVKPKE